MSVEYKQKNDVPDLYKILGLTNDVCKESDCDERIRKAYARKAKKYHPDKYPGKKDIVEIFELITMAYDVLKDEKQRNEYNQRLIVEKQACSDYLKLKKRYNDFADSIGELKEPSNEQKLSFKEQMKAINSKHGYDTSQEAAIPANQAKKKLSSLAKERANQDVNLRPEKLFDEGRFDLGTFNAVFDKYHKKSDSSIMPHNGVPSAWNEPTNSMNFSSFDNLDNIYVDDNSRLDISRQMFGDIDFGSSLPKISKQDISDIGRADYVDGHKVLGDDYYKDLKSKISEREKDSDLFDKMEYGDYKKDTAGYGVLDQLGCDFSEIYLDKCLPGSLEQQVEKLMAERKKVIPPTEFQYLSAPVSSRTNSSVGR
ncbi:chaperone protein dnaj [Acanthamoeba polyphaga mimivirus]|uniref:Chaperone protein dnaj n=1 Tax=Acanthamoeba polyphaga mimivirus Kroon TaxID=3069720 RepID=A0A0G2Y6K0_9VIRU|nr:chaperone protein dnaj [Acanthamoeba polyphaga mimivirus]AKI80179.1 chaperone protein dnaj [Acanthamoeba polyphaga mimivirus Kroon]